jgi:hypothetical protein
MVYADPFKVLSSYALRADFTSLLCVIVSFFIPVEPLRTIPQFQALDFFFLQNVLFSFCDSRQRYGDRLLFILMAVGIRKAIVKGLLWIGLSIPAFSSFLGEKDH